MASNNLLVTLTIAAKNKTAKALGKVNQGFKDITKSVLSLKGALIGLTGGLLFKSAVSSAADFEEALDKIQAASGATFDEMARITAKAEELGGSTRYTATEVADGLNVLAKAGQNVDEQLLSISHVLSLAQGQGKSLDETAGFLVTTLKTLGLEANEVGRVTDIWSKAASMAYVDITDLGEAVKYSAAQAKIANLSAEGYAAALVKLAQNGIKGSAAGTGLAEVLKQLEFATTGTRTALAGLGDSSGELVSSLDTMHKSGPKAAAVFKALGANSKTAFALMKGGAEGFNEVVDNLTKIKGAAADAAAVMDSNLVGAMAGLGSAWDAVRRSLVTPLLEPMTKAARGLAETFQGMVASGTLDRWSESLVNGFSGASESVKAFIREFDFQKLSNDFSSFTKGVGDNLSGIAAVFTNTANGIKVFYNGFTAAIKLTGAAVTGFAALVNEAFSGIIFALNKIGAIPDSIYNSFKKGTGLLKAESKAFFDGFIQDADDIGAAFNNMSAGAESTAKSIKQIAESEKQVAQIVGQELIPMLSLADQIAKDAADSQSRIAEEADKSSKAYIDALNKLGVKSAEAWGNEVKIARAALDQVKNNVNSNMDDIRAAYLEYSKTVLAANESSTISVRKLRQEELRTEAALLGIGGRIEKMIKRSERGVKDFITLDGQFEQQGIKTKKVLEDELKAAEDLFNQIKAQKGAVEDIGAAYENLKTKAAAAGKKETEVFDAIGKSAADANKRIRAETEQTKKSTEQATKSTKDYGDAAEEAGDKDAEAKEKSKSAAGSMGDYVGRVYSEIGNRLGELSDKSQQAFQDMTNGTSAAQVAFRESAGDIDGSLADMDKALARTNSNIQHNAEIARKNQRTMEGWAAGVENQAFMIEKAFIQEKKSAERLALSLDDAAASGAANLHMIADATMRADDEFNLLDDQDLSHLRQSISDAEQQIESMNNAALSAVDSLAELNRSQEESLLRAQGKDEELQRLKHQEQLDRIAELEETGGAAADREATRARELANQLHAEEMARIKERKVEETNRSREDRSRQRNSNRQQTTEQPTGGGLRSETVINIDTAYGDKRSMEDLARRMRGEMQRLDRLGG